LREPVDDAAAHGARDRGLDGRPAVILDLR
jgi:hypothetical protein